jgi:hypothetical protein
MSSKGYKLTDRFLRQIAKTIRRVNILWRANHSGAGTVKPHRNVPPEKAWYKIVTNAGGGDYTVMFQQWGTTGTPAVLDALENNSDAHHPEYNLNQPARDFQGRDSGYVGQLVPGWQTWVNGLWYLVIDVGCQKVLLKITGATAIGAANNGPDGTTTEWTYSAVEVTETVVSGVLTYTTVSGGLTFTNKLLNRCEKDNRNVGTGGVFGNGVAWDDLDTDFNGFLKPVPTNAIVEATLLMGDEETPLQWASFWFPNAVGGECES